MKKKKHKENWLKEIDIEVGYLYFTNTNQYRAILAMRGDFLIYVPSSEGIEVPSSKLERMPFENSPFKKCQIATFAKKDYQIFTFNGAHAIRHQLNNTQLAEAISQCNAISTIDDFLSK